MLRTTLISLRATFFTLLLCSGMYPLTVWGLGQLLFPAAANGSLVGEPHGTVGSELLAQPFSQAAYLQPRPSAAGATGYDATASGGSNLGPASQKLKDRVQAEVVRLKKENPEAALPIPADLVTASASGLDPHLSPEAASWQAPRIAHARNVPVERVRELLEVQQEDRDLGFLGEPRVNVLRFNLAIDRQLGAPLRR